MSCTKGLVYKRPNSLDVIGLRVYFRKVSGYLFEPRYTEAVNICIDRLTVAVSQAMNFYNIEVHWSRVTEHSAGRSGTA